MLENKYAKVQIDDKNTRSSHALIDRNLLKSMQNDITSASELISSLREEKEKLCKVLQQLQQDNHDKNNTIRSLKGKVKYLENIEEDEEVVKGLNQANMKLKNEIELSLHGIYHKNNDFASEIIDLTESFLNRVHDKPKAYQVFKTHMKTSNHFKQIIGNENWGQATILLLRFIKDSFPDEGFKAKPSYPEQSSDEDSEQENYNKIIQDSKHLLNTLSYQKSKLEGLNHEFASRGIKNPTLNSPQYRVNLSNNLTSENPKSTELKKDSSHITNLYTANKIVKNVSKYKNLLKK
ncbi:hypothetical protein SteCoe_15611 [Stentor coeruleus]|uniref:Uncharacterized protein n=1 Tax=Stentor coeruleus TaxID=5963 RepID=A0A1R2C344_9CILI|nr:hypothetical protein SteCoe_15611 [Stentor coeruleus]